MLEELQWEEFQEAFGAREKPLLTELQEKGDWEQVALSSARWAGQGQGRAELPLEAHS